MNRFDVIITSPLHHMGTITFMECLHFQIRSTGQTHTQSKKETKEPSDHEIIPKKRGKN